MREAPRVLIELKPSSINGVGVFSVPRIYKGDIVADGVHEEDYDSIVPWNDFRFYNPNIQEKILAFCVGTPDGFVPPENLDFNKLSVDWYFNHSCAGNCGFNEDGDFVAIKNLDQNEELTYDYALAESNPDFRMICNCGSQQCRKVITGNDWKDEEFQAKHQDHMLPRLRRLIIPIPA
jgi:hypothetical protein